jgi:hypothetical protein
MAATVLEIGCRRKIHVRRVSVKASLPNTFELGAPIRHFPPAPSLVNTHHRHDCLKRCAKGYPDNASLV